MSKPAQLFLTGILALVCVATPAARAQSANHPSEAGNDWPFYGRDAGGMRYSPLAQINRQNVATLKVAWTFHVGDISDGTGGKKRSGLEPTPILVDGTLYLTSGFNRVFALDPETGKQRWVYDPMIELAGNYGDGLINRGVAAWLDPARARKGNPAAGEFSKLPWMRGSLPWTAPRASHAGTSATADKSVYAMSHATFPRNIT